MGGGDFSTEAYEQLRKAYSDEQQRQVDDELKGTQIMGQDYGLETVPVDSPWADKIEKWEYPSGRGQHMDEKQSPDEILQIMRDSAQERLDAAKEAEDEAAAEEEDLDSVAEAEETDEDESDEVDIAEMSDEEFDAHIDAIVSDVDDDDDDDDDEDEDEDDSDEDESDEDDDESDTEDEEETEEDDLVLIPADDLAAQIAELRAELEGMQFVSDSEEEPESDESD